jgi:hypothetical protein
MQWSKLSAVDPSTEFAIGFNLQELFPKTICCDFSREVEQLLSDIYTNSFYNPFKQLLSDYAAWIELHTDFKPSKAWVQKKKFPLIAENKLAQQCRNNLNKLIDCELVEQSEILSLSNDMIASAATEFKKYLFGAYQHKIERMSAMYQRRMAGCDQYLLIHATRILESSSSLGTLSKRAEVNKI